MSYPRTDRLPPGFRKVSVILSDKEFDRVKGSAALQPHGTYSEAVRALMGLPPSPYRLMSRLKEQHEAEALANRPHSRACGLSNHEHGPECARDCPTCWPHVYPNNNEE